MNPEVVDAGAAGDASRHINVDIVAATIEDKSIVRHLVELYVYDFSEYMEWDVDEHGLFGYQYLDNYWTEPDRHPFLIRVDGKLAGFAFVRANEPVPGTCDMAEFFVLRKYRRRGIGIVAALALFARFPGAWQVRQMELNKSATEFWHRAIPVAFTETIDDNRPVQHFTVGID